MKKNNFFKIVLFLISLGGFLPSCESLMQAIIEEFNSERAPESDSNDKVDR